MIHRSHIRFGQQSPFIGRGVWCFAIVILLFLTVISVSWSEASQDDPGFSEDFMEMSIEDLMSVKITSVGKKTQALSEAAAAISPDVVIPMHYGHIEGTDADPEKFKRLVGEKNPDITVIILQDKE